MNQQMGYIALARKWRPRTFSALIGQHHVSKALMNSLHQQRLHHAYLFTGSRGVGKTSVARLLAKSLNCEQGIQAEPCLQCDTCVAIEQGRFFDLIEIDGASKTRIEDTRELLDNIQYAPTSGRFKIYLIDEVHMLSQHSFNALLKTLEEPPEHVKFLLATTDPQKLPLTILSRCLQFNLKLIEPAIISQHLEYILTQENVPYEKPALDLLANAARGSVRDALSLLDHAIACSANTINSADVKNALGYTQQDYALQLLKALVDMEPHTLIRLSKQIAIEGGHFHHVANEMLHYLHRIGISQTIPEATACIAETPDIQTLGTQFTPEDIQLLYQINLKGIEELSISPSLIIGFEMMLLRMYTFRPAPPSTIPPLAYTCASPLPAVPTEPVTFMPKASTTMPLTPPSTPELPWNKLLPTLQLTGLALTAAEQATWIKKSGNAIYLRVAKGHQTMFTQAVRTRIESALKKHYQEPIILSFEYSDEQLSSPAQQREEIHRKSQHDAASALQDDPFFQQLQHEFSAELLASSIEPIENLP